MGHRFNVIKRTFDTSDAVIAFIDLLGTRKLYESTSTETQATRAFKALLQKFDIAFSEHFTEKEIKDGNFDVSIFADSIAISVRIKTRQIVERLVDFLLKYRPSPSRAILIKDSFFSLKVTNASKKSILGSKFTNISLCGGRGIRFAHDCLEGLPIGVYVTGSVKEDLNKEQQERAIPVKGERLFFIKQQTGAIPSLPQETLEWLGKNPTAGRRDILNSLRASYQDQDVFEKRAQWILVHLGKQNEIIRSKKRRKRAECKSV